jgi:hypothetical protein
MLGDSSVSLRKEIRMALQGRKTPCHCGSGRKYKNCHLRADKEREKLVAIAMHEAGHAIANFYYDIPIGDEGVWVNDEDNGYTDSKTTARYGKGRLSEHTREERQGYFVASVIGPVVEFRHRNLLFDQIDSHIRFWLADFAAAVGVTGSHRTSTAVIFNPEEYAIAGQLTLACFAMLAYPEREAYPITNPALPELGAELKEAMLVADKMASVYAEEIKQFADLLLTKKKVSKEECAEWARKFQRRAVLDSFIPAGVLHA